MGNLVKFKKRNSLGLLANVKVALCQLAELRSSLVKIKKQLNPEAKVLKFKDKSK